MYAHHMDFLIRVWGLVMGLVDVFVVVELASFSGARKIGGSAWYTLITHVQGIS